MSEAKLGLTKEVMATKVLPYLFPLSIENGLSVAQYSAVMTLIRDLIGKFTLGLVSQPSKWPLNLNLFISLYRSSGN